MCDDMTNKFFSEFTYPEVEYFQLLCVYFLKQYCSPFWLHSSFLIFKGSVVLEHPFNEDDKQNETLNLIMITFLSLLA